VVAGNLGIAPPYLVKKNSGCSKFGHRSAVFGKCIGFHWVKLKEGLAGFPSPFWVSP